MLPTMLPVSSTPAPWSYMPGSTVSLPFTRIEAGRDCLMSHRFTIGVEEEFQIVDPNTWELRSHVSELLAAGSALGDQMKREMHQSIVELGTNICEDTGQLQHEVLKIRSELCRAADRAGLAVAAAGPHPFSPWIDQAIPPGERYENIVEELQQLAHSLLIFGMHVHVAMPDRTSAIGIMN